MGVDGAAYFGDERGVALGVKRECFPVGRDQESGQGNGGQVMGGEHGGSFLPTFHPLPWKRCMRSLMRLR
jgi:hypothetical protein